jgi:hypothetical protein
LQAVYSSRPLLGRRDGYTACGGRHHDDGNTGATGAGRGHVGRVVEHDDVLRLCCSNSSREIEPASTGL